MQIGNPLWRKPLPLLLILIVGLVASGCNLSPTGDTAPETFEGAPTVQLFSPLPNQTFLTGTTVNIQARIENAGADIARVTIYLDNAIVGDAAQPNQSGAAAFSVTQDWLTSGTGQYEIAVIAERADGTTSDRASVLVTVIDQANAAGEATVTPTDAAQTTTDSEPTDIPVLEPTIMPTQVAPTAIPAATEPPAPTDPPAPTNTPAPTDPPSQPMARIIGGANVRSGPGTVFDPPVGSIAANEETEIVAVNPAGDWYKIRYYNGTAWISAQLVSATGNLASLPVEVGPPTPVPPTPTFTPVPATPTLTPVPINVNLALASGGIRISPHPLVCQETSQVTVDIINNGTEATQSGGRVFVEAVLESTGAVLESTYTTFDAIPAGGTVTSNVAFLTVSTNYDEPQVIRVTLDIDNQIAESNENDNTSSDGTRYSLSRGNCG